LRKINKIKNKLQYLNQPTGLSASLRKNIRTKITGSHTRITGRNAGKHKQGTKIKNKK